MTIEYQTSSPPRSILAAALQAIRTTASAWSVRLFPSADRQRDSYLSGAVDHIDLEQRIRNWERRLTPFWDNL